MDIIEVATTFGGKFLVMLGLAVARKTHPVNLLPSTANGSARETRSKDWIDEAYEMMDADTVQGFMECNSTVQRVEEAAAGRYRKIRLTGPVPDNFGDWERMEAAYKTVNYTQPVVKATANKEETIT